MAEKDFIEQTIEAFTEEAGKVGEDQDRVNETTDRMNAFGAQLHQYWEINRDYRRSKELEWLQDLRQWKGLYDPEQKIPEGLSRVYPKISRSKGTQVLSRLHEMLFPDQEENWEIEPTEDPKIAKEIVLMIAKSLVKQDEQGQMVMPTPEQVRAAIKKYTQESCKKMSGVIATQLTDMAYPEEAKDVLRSGIKLGTGLVKGPLIHERKLRVWQPDHTGDYTEHVSPKDSPYYESIRIWDWYPDMSTVDADQMDGCFERHVYTKHFLRELAKRPDFFADVIAKFIQENPEGNYVPENWETDLQAIEVEAGTGKETAVSGSSTAASQPASIRKLGKKYVVLEFWGWVDGKDLETCGIKFDKPEDALKEHGANIWLLGNRIIKAKLYDHATEMYNVFYFEKDETSIFGNSLPRVIRHSQIAIASASRKMLDDAAVCGPQVECNVSLMWKGSDINDIYSRKVWYREGRGVESQYPAIRIIDINPHTEQLKLIIDIFKEFADSESTLPTWIIGQAAGNETAQASSSRRSEVTISIKDIIRSFDVLNSKVIKGLYNWNMDFNERTDIKGDYTIKSRGSSLVAKEIRMQMLNDLHRTMTPEDWDYIPRAEFLAEKFKAHDVKINLRTDEEVAQLRADREDKRARELSYQVTEADIAHKKAQALAQLARAKDKNVDANNKEAGADLEQMSKQIEMAGKMQDIEGSGGAAPAAPVGGPVQ